MNTAFLDQNTPNEQTPFNAFHDRASIGFFRSDGDFELLATLNNGGDFMPPSMFDSLVKSVVKALNQAGSVDDIVALHRQDAMDIISMDDE